MGMRRCCITGWCDDERIMALGDYAEANDRQEEGMRAEPPIGFARFVWEHVPGPKGSGMMLPICPNCRAVFSGVWMPTRWQGDARFRDGRCSCGCRFWHDFGDKDDDADWNYYYAPIRGQLTLF